jgi:hypothetical protein
MEKKKTTTKKEKPYKVTHHTLTNEYTISAMIDGYPVSMRTYKEKGERLSSLEKRCYTHLVEKVQRLKLTLKKKGK